MILIAAQRLKTINSREWTIKKSIVFLDKDIVLGQNYIKSTKMERGPRPGPGRVRPEPAGTGRVWPQTGLSLFFS